MMQSDVDHFCQQVGTSTEYRFARSEDNLHGVQLHTKKRLYHMLLNLSFILSLP